MCSAELSQVAFAPQFGHGDEQSEAKEAVERKEDGLSSCAQNLCHAKQTKISGEALKLIMTFDKLDRCKMSSCSSSVLSLSVVPANW